MKRRSRGQQGCLIVHVLVASVVMIVMGIALGISLRWMAAPLAGAQSLEMGFGEIAQSPEITSGSIVTIEFIFYAGLLNNAGDCTILGTRISFIYL